MATLAVQRPPTALTYAPASAGGDQYPNSGREILHVRNGGASAITVTRNSQRQCDQGFDHDETTTVPAGEDRMLKAADQRRFGTMVQVTYSAVDSVTVGVIG